MSHTPAWNAVTPIIGFCRIALVVAAGWWVVAAPASVIGLGRAAYMPQKDFIYKLSLIGSFPFTSIYNLLQAFTSFSEIHLQALTYKL